MSQRSLGCKSQVNEISDAAMLKDGIGRGKVAGKESAELSESRAGFVKSHLIDDFLEKLRVSSPKGNAPFPIIEAYRGGYQLCDATSKSHAALRVFGHHC